MNIKSFAVTFAAGASIAAAALLPVAAPASAAPQPTVQHGRTAPTAPQRPAQRPASPTVQPGQQKERQQAEKESAQLHQQQAGQGTDPGEFLPNPPVVTPGG